MQSATSSTASAKSAADSLGRCEVSSVLSCGAVRPGELTTIKVAISAPERRRVFTCRFPPCKFGKRDIVNNGHKRALIYDVPFVLSAKSPDRCCALAVRPITGLHDCVRPLQEEMPPTRQL